MHLQSKAAESIAVGFQHDHEGTIHALRNIYQKHGLLGLWRGASGAVPRLAVGSASQLATFYTFREFLETYQVCSRLMFCGGLNYLEQSYYYKSAQGKYYFTLIITYPLSLISSSLYI